jgi:hypothetical protein
VVCALIVCAAFAQGANGAATTYTCVKNEGAKDYSDSLCKNGVAPGTGEYGHFGIVANTPTKISGESIGNVILKATTGGVAAVFTATGVAVEPVGVGEPAFIENKAPGGVMEATGEVILKLTGATANHNCTVVGGAITTKRLIVHTLAPNELKFEQKVAGGEFAAFGLAGAACLLPKAWTITGTVIGTISGATISFTHVGTTGQGTLFAQGTILAGLEGTLVFKGENGNPLAFT